MGFSDDTVEKAWNRQNGLCAFCGKRLVYANRGKDDCRGAWEPHHKKPIQHGGTHLLRNCAILCINGDNCHLTIGHKGHYKNHNILYDDALEHLYDGC
jgi:hypothetical protein